MDPRTSSIIQPGECTVSPAVTFEGVIVGVPDEVICSDSHAIGELVTVSDAITKLLDSLDS